MNVRKDVEKKDLLYTFGRNVSATNFEKLYGVPDKLKNGTIV
jgi:hypothetical protein